MGIYPRYSNVFRGSRDHALLSQGLRGGNVLSTALVNILKGELKEKGKEIPFKHWLLLIFILFPPLLSSLGVMGSKRKICRLYSTIRKKQRK
jgi:hypothetical protein